MLHTSILQALKENSKIKHRELPETEGTGENGKYINSLVDLGQATTNLLALYHTLSKSFSRFLES